MRSLEFPWMQYPHKGTRLSCCAMDRASTSAANSLSMRHISPLSFLMASVEPQGEVEQQHKGKAKNRYGQSVALCLVQHQLDKSFGQNRNSMRNTRLQKSGLHKDHFYKQHEEHKMIITSEEQLHSTEAISSSDDCSAARRRLKTIAALQISWTRSTQPSTSERNGMEWSEEMAV
uniref:Uncharacterized protein n=1 Tax=Oryza punctata TaxID=4537 RepID=A0A0E0JVP5_ORYPU